jgi:hypothetical protein
VNTRSSFDPVSLNALYRAVEINEQAARIWWQAITGYLTNVDGLGSIQGQDAVMQRLTQALDCAIALTNADMGNIQIFDPYLRVLTIAVQRGFDRRFLDFFSVVKDEQTACGAAMKNRRSIFVKDVTQSPVFRSSPALEVLLDAKVRAVQSIPLLGASGALLGVLSTHSSRSCSFASGRRISWNRTNRVRPPFRELAEEFADRQAQLTELPNIKRKS